MYRDRQNVVLYTRFSKLFSINIQYCVYCINNLVHGCTVHSTDRQATYSLHTVFSALYWVYRKYCTECIVLSVMFWVYTYSMYCWRQIFPDSVVYILGVLCSMQALCNTTGFTSSWLQFIAGKMQTGQSTAPFSEPDRVKCSSKALCLEPDSDEYVDCWET